MANSSVTDLTGNCFPPFLDASKFTNGGGFVDGRFCAQITSLQGQPTCCLPCPATNWAYSDSFVTYTVVSEWFNVAGLVLMVFMLLSYAVLPVQQTRSHYLSVCLVVSIIMLALGFTIPLAAKPEQCYDAITPNWMYTSTECAWSGALIIAGGLTIVVWIFIRALSMNLQICWDIVPGKKFFYISQVVGWGLPAVLFALTITLTGVSFRFGPACHVNHKDSMADFWGPLLAIAGGAGILQLATFGYCIHVYLRNFWDDQAKMSTSGSASGTLPSYQGSVRTQTGKAIYRRLKEVLWLQWRGICIVSIIMVDVVFFSIVFVYMDGMQASLKTDISRVEPWLVCLSNHPTNKNACLSLVNGWLINEQTIIAVLIMLSLAGFQVFFLLTRPAVFLAWWHLLRAPFTSRREFISLDGARPTATRSYSQHCLLQHQNSTASPATSTFEMQSKKPMVHEATALAIDIKEPFSNLSSPDEIRKSPLHETAATDPTTLAIARDSVPPEHAGHPDTSRVANAFSLHSHSPAIAAATGRPIYGIHRHTHDHFFQQLHHAHYHHRPPSAPRNDSSASRNDSLASNGDIATALVAARSYRAPVASFSAPRAPSRSSSLVSSQPDSPDANEPVRVRHLLPETSETQDGLVYSGERVRATRRRDEARGSARDQRGGRRDQDDGTD